MGICVSCRRRDLQALDKRAARAGGGRAPAKGAAAELLPRRVDPAMANSISNIKMTNPIKGIVSKRRRRYIKDGFNLDLAYITDRLIAMGFPAEKLEGVYRNHIDEVYRFLEQMHKDHYKIYNLCSERCYDSSKFHGRVARYAFEDHTPPKMELIQPFCEDVHSWLSADPRNVAAVHCKAGKGRTGTMLCCYLLYSGQKPTADEALKYYGNKRTHDEKGVTIPSQRRYVEYYAALVCGGLSYRAPALHIRELHMQPPPALSAPACTLELTVSPPNKTAAVCHEVRKADAAIRLVLEQCVPLRGDVRVDVYSKPKMMMRKEKLFHFWFNTFFVANCVGAVRVSPPQDSVNLETFKLTLNKWQLDDAHKDKQHKLYSPDFKVELIVQQQPAGARCLPPAAPRAPSPASASDSEPDPDSEHWDSGETAQHSSPCPDTRGSPSEDPHHSSARRSDRGRRRDSETTPVARHFSRDDSRYSRSGNGQADPGDTGRGASETTPANGPGVGDFPFDRDYSGDTVRSSYVCRGECRRASQTAPVIRDSPRGENFRQAVLGDTGRRASETPTDRPGAGDSSFDRDNLAFRQTDPGHTDRRASETTPTNRSHRASPDNGSSFHDRDNSQDFFPETSPVKNGRGFYRQASETPTIRDGSGERNDFFRQTSLGNDNNQGFVQRRSPPNNSRGFLRKASEANPVPMDDYRGLQTSKATANTTENCQGLRQISNNSQTFRQPLGSVTSDDALSFSVHEGYCCRLDSDIDGTHAYLDFTNRCQCSNQREYMRLDEFSSGTVCPHGYVRLDGQNAASCQHEHVPLDNSANAPTHTKLSGLANKCKGFFRPISPAERMDVCEVCDDPKQKKSASKCSKLHMNCLDSNSQKDSHKKLDSHVSKDGYILIDRTPRQQTRVSDHDCRTHTDLEPSSKCTRLSDPTGTRKGKHIGKDGYMLVDATPRQPPGSSNTRLQTSPNEFFGAQDMRNADETYMEFTTSDGYMKPVEQAKSNFQDEYALMGPDMSEVTSDKHCMLSDTSPTADETKADKSSKNKKHSFFKRDDYKNDKGKIPKVSSDHTISDDKNDKKKYTFFQRREEEGSKPRLSLFSVKWPENRKKKDRDDS